MGNAESDTRGNEAGEREFPPGEANELSTETQFRNDTAKATIRRVGQYHLKRVIASGGMGTVYEAIQEHPRRAVAVKIMSRGIASRSALRRFEYESQLLARLRHPGIAQVYEAGTHRDEAGTVPFFAMEYIPNALPVTKYVREKGLGTRQRLALFAQVCDAVHHGHQKGIIHRDLKPANILVDSQGRPKIIDFGVARSTDSDMAVTTLQTDVGQLVGTVQYMSPEQCGGDPHDLDIRSDVYALGVVLYELLCGKLPYDVSRVPIHEATRVIRDERPASLSTVNRALRGDVETIVTKALEKERDRRYQSAADLARDIGRYLNKEPISARPPNMSYQLLVFARRHKAGCGAIAAIFVVLVVGVIVSTSLYVRAETALEKAEARRAEAEEVTQFLCDAVSSANPAQAQGREITVREMVDAAATAIGGAFHRRPLAEAAVRRALGNTYRALGKYAPAERHLREALRLARERLGPDDLEVALANSDLAKLLHDNGDYDGAERLWRETLRVRRQILGEDHKLVAESQTHLGILLFRRGDYEAAEPFYRNALAIRRRNLPSDHHDIAHSLNALATLAYAKGDYPEAEDLYRESLSMRRRLFGDDHPDVVESLNNLAGALAELGQYDAAESFYREALAAYYKLHGSEHTDIARCLSNLGDLAVKRGDLEAAEPLVRDAVAIQRRCLPDRDHQETGVMLLTLGEVLLGRQQLDEAETTLREACTMFRRLLSADHPYVSIGESILGECLGLRGQFDEAETLLLRSYNSLAKTRGNSDTFARQALRRVVDLYERSGKPDKVEAYRAKLGQ